MYPPLPPCPASDWVAAALAPAPDCPASSQASMAAFHGEGGRQGRQTMAFVVQGQATPSSNRHGFLPLFLPGCTKRGHLGAVDFLTFDLKVTVQIGSRVRMRGRLSEQQSSAWPQFSLYAKAVCSAQQCLWMARVTHPGVAGRVRRSGPLKQRQWKLGRAFQDSDNPISRLRCSVGLSHV